MSDMTWRGALAWDLRCRSVPSVVKVEFVSTLDAGTRRERDIFPSIAVREITVNALHSLFSHHTSHTSVCIM
jgi:hypothetical protein